MKEIILEIFQVRSNFALEVWFSIVVVFSSRLDRFVITCKNCNQSAYFLQKVGFCIFEPKAPLNFSPLKCTYLGKSSFQNN